MKQRRTVLGIHYAFDVNHNQYNLNIDYINYKTWLHFRNRRLFNNLLVGTLRQFQKDEDNKSHSQVPNTTIFYLLNLKFDEIYEAIKIDKQREVELRLEQSDKENKDRMQKEKEELLIKRREKEMEIVSLRRKKAIQQYVSKFLIISCILGNHAELGVIFCRGST